MQRINLNSVRIFAAAARHLNFKRAGDELNLSHGAVSQRIKQLELELGVSLFDRNPRGVSLTSVGAKYANTVMTALGILEDAASEVRQSRQEITLHISPSLAAKWFMPRLPLLANTNPDLKISTEARDEVLNRPFNQNEAAIRHAKVFKPTPGQNFARLTELKIIGVCAPAISPQNGRLQFENLLNLPLIQDSHRRWDRLIQRQESTSNTTPLSFNRTALAIDAAVNAQGVALVPTLLVQQELKNGRLTEVWRDPETSGEYLFLVWPKGQSKTAPIMQVVEWITSAFDLGSG